MAGRSAWRYGILTAGDQSLDALIAASARAGLLSASRLAGPMWANGYSIEPLRKGARDRLRAFDRKPCPLGFDEAHVAAPPANQSRERSPHADRLGKSRVADAHRRLGLLEQHVAPPMAANFEPHHQRLPGQRRKTDAPLHVDQHRLQIEVLARRLAPEPALPPGGERAHQSRELLTRFGQLVLGAMRAVRPGERSNQDELLQPFGQHGARHPRHAPANVVEAAAAAHDFAYDQKRPPAAQHFVGARNGAELSISWHARNLARRAGRCGTDSGP